MTAPFGRVLTAMVTPFTADGSVDYDKAAALARRLVDEGNDGLVISGTTGEAPTTHRDEKIGLLRAVVEAVGDRAHVIAGVGSNDTAHAVSMAEQASSAGATGLLAVTPYYNKPPQAGIIAHTEAILGATGLPVMLYDIPARTGVPLTHETIVTLAQHPQVVALKDAKDDLAATSWVLRETDLAVYSGTDALNLPLLSLGAVGMVSVVSHVVTPQLVAMCNAFFSGDVVKAAEINLALQPVYTGMFRTQGVILSKAALRLLGFDCGGLRLPHVEATEDQIRVLRADLTAAGVLA